ncbi:alpha-glucosidase family protein [Almyronema epifaneia]|uniref:Alpha-glucosidase family protein n=1 Tax=Almyronema epifaneia S1 TaxID=2991925 RepID=A0ABW6IG51_9CYAN
MVVGSTYPAVISRQESPDWWRSAFIYQIYPRSFMDSSGDGVGDLAGILQKLDYVMSLGVDAIWISPFFKSPMKDFGYDISDYCAVDPIFGTLQDFQQILAAAHQRGLKVLIDQVWNHTSDQHPWFQESRSSRDNPKADWYVWADPKPDGTPPTNWLATFGGSVWTWEPRRQQYYLHNFLVEQPDLNWYNLEVIEAIKQVARFWLDMGVDGFRLDVVNFYLYDRQLRDNPQRPANQPRPAGAAPNDPFFSQLNLYNFCQPNIAEVLQPIRQLMDEYPGSTTLAEISSAEDTIATSSEYVRGRDRLHMAYNSSLMNDEPLTHERLYQLIAQVEAAFGDGVICWTAGTHDFPRLKSRWSKFHVSADVQEQFDHLFVALLISLRGSCCIYQGDELGLTQAEIPFEKMQDPFGIAGYPSMLGRDGSRTPMPWYKDQPQAGFTTALEPWLPIPAEHQRAAVDVQAADPNSLLNQYRQLIHWRRQQPALRQGQLTLLPMPAPVLAFIRHCRQQKLLCVFNLSFDSAQLSLTPYPGCQDQTETGFTYQRQGDRLELPPYGVYFGELSQ